VSGRAGASDIARQTFYFHRTIQDAVGEMSRSGLVTSRRQGRERLYALSAPEKWESLLELDQGALNWVCWPPLLSALEAIWLCIQPDAFAKLPPLLQMSELRKLMREGVSAKLGRSGLTASLPDAERLAGMAYLDELLVAIRNLLG
jgi:DNA-binding transcriptional ArsR family regulator